MTVDYFIKKDDFCQTEKATFHGFQLVVLIPCACARGKFKQSVLLVCLSAQQIWKFRHQSECNQTVGNENCLFSADKGECYKSCVFISHAY